MAKNNNESAPELQAGLSEVSAIRDILFGTHMKTYENRFNELSAKLDEIHEKLNTSISDLDQRVSNDMATMEDKLVRQHDKDHAALLDKISKLSEQKTDRVALGKMLIQIGEKLSS